MCNLYSITANQAAIIALFRAIHRNVRQPEDEVDLAFRVNAQAPRILARWAATNSVPIVHFSTDYVFDGSGQRPWREDDPTCPLSVYGTSKLAGEIGVREIGGVHLVVRTSWVFSSTGTNFLNTILRLASEQAALRIVSDQFGAPTSARSIAHGIMSIISGSAGSPMQINMETIARKFSQVDGLLHMSNAGETNWCGFACAIVEGLRARGFPLAVREIVPIATKDYPTRALRPRNSRLDLTRLDEQFGLQMPHWHDALTHELADLASRRSMKAG
jgi:dTDP-4-dehydrorhamnose reductase